MKAILISAMLILVTSMGIVPFTGACDLSDPDCVHHIDLKGLIRLPCDDEGDCKHIEVKELMLLVCDFSDGCDDHHINLKGLMKLACDMETGDDCDYRPDLKGLQRLACGTEPCFKRDFKKLGALASLQGLKPQRIVLMGVGKNRDPKSTSYTSVPLPFLTESDLEEMPDLKFLLGKKIPVDVQDTNGTTLLMVASARGFTKLAEALLKKGADVELMANNGGTALFYAASKGHVEIVKMLIAKGAKVNRTNKSNLTPLHWAARNNHPDVVKILLKHKADPNIKTVKGETPLALAASKGHERVAKMLKEARTR